MRAVVRTVLLLGILFVFFAISLLGWHHRDDWRTHTKNFQDHLQKEVQKITPPSLSEYIPASLKSKPMEHQVAHGGFLPWLGDVEVEPLPYPSEREKAVVMAQLSSEDTSWVREKIPE